MIPRRSLLRTTLALVGGATLSTGVTAGSAESTTASTQRDDTVTTAVATLEPSVIEVTGLPDPLDSLVADARDRTRSLSLEDIASVTGRAAIHGDAVVGGRAVVTGSFDTQAIESELRDHDLEFVAADRRDDGDSRFVASNDSYAVAVGPSAIRIGYGRTRSRARSRLDAAFEPLLPARRRTRPTASYGALSALLDGHAVVYADLGSGTRSHLLDSLSDAPDELGTVVEAANALGVALEAGSARTRLRYGVVADPARLSGELLETLVDEATTGDNSLSSATIHRDGQTVIVDAAVETRSLWCAHERLVTDSS
ncbi:hypothetical protein RBH26_11545 [Natronolimnohabitans sp. A-GB9]|uniref:hypothetical protein n=1 Tax=Natronolimnohabitans sp. A-GB9 TaxID=3069757 RepID=UPI0027B57830|nr:hypothetical protein [Natronolimnohabitans sp. A-GB9]MDQ2051115.1 hypothetical protein [Natronolimnohabitans sp. A-GB9]